MLPTVTQEPPSKVGAGSCAALAVVARFDPLIMAGKMSVLKNDASGMLYRMTDAEPVAMPAK